MTDQSTLGAIQQSILSTQTTFSTGFDASEMQQQPCKISPSDLPVRRSTRDIKRKKFDDELLDGSVVSSIKKSRQSIGGDRPSSSAATTSCHSPSLSLLQAPMTPKNMQQQQTCNQTPAVSPAFVQDSMSLSSFSRPSASAVAESAVNITNPSMYDSVAALNSLADQAPPTEPSSRKPVANFPLPPSSTPTAVTPMTSAAATPTPATATTTTTKKRRRQSRRAAPSSTPNASSLSTASMIAVEDLDEAQEKAAALKDVGRWQAVDDLALITAVMQANDLAAVYAGIKFSCKFTLEEIQARWYALLYDQLISRYAQEAIKQLPPEVVIAVQSNTLFSKSEEKLLMNIPSTMNPITLNVFESLLDQTPESFHFARTPTSLMSHWQNMREYNLLCDQKHLLATSHNGPSFSDIEDNLDDDPCMDFVGENFIDRDLIMCEKNLTKQIKKLEQELPKWHVLVESVTGLPSQDLDSSTLAALRGRMVRYLIRAKEVTIGRNSKDFQVDIDLSLEGPAFKLSRKLGVIRLRPTGDFYFTNESAKAAYVDGKPLVTGSKSKLNNNSVLEFSCIRLVFTVNLELIAAMKHEASKVINI